MWRGVSLGAGEFYTYIYLYTICIYKYIYMYICIYLYIYMAWYASLQCAYTSSLRPHIGAQAFVVTRTKACVVGIA